MFAVQTTYKMKNIFNLTKYILSNNINNARL